jgi:deoxyadenosine/deoxycytidine kinase
LARLYDEWISGFSLCPVLTIPSDDLDFVNNGTHLELIATKVLEKLQGKETVDFATDTARA